MTEITIRKRPLVSLHKDTLIYEASAVRTSANAVVDDILSKLPGLDVYNDGLISAQGKTVQRILVDGKPYFGTDGKQATRTIPAHLIDQIQVFDQRSDRTVFSGLDDGQRIRTINIVLKPTGHRERFGQQIGGIGPEGRYQVGAGLNQLGVKRQFSFVAQTNSINQSGYSLPISSGRQINSLVDNVSTDGGGMMTQSAGASIGFSDRLGKKVDLATTYQTGATATQLHQLTNRQTFLPPSFSVDSLQSDLASSQQSMTTARLASHLLNTRLNVQPNAQTIIRLNPSLSINRAERHSTITSQTFTDRQSLLNQGMTVTRSNDASWSFANTGSWMHRFRRAGQILSLSTNSSLSRQHNQSINQSYFIAGDRLATTSINQYQYATQYYNQVSNELMVSYTQPLHSQQTIEFRYTGLTDYSSAARSVADIDSVNSNRLAANDSLSNQYRNRIINQRLGLSWQVRSTRFSYAIGFDIQRINQRSTVGPGTAFLNRVYTNVIPSLLIEPRLTNNRALQLQYQTYSVTPSVAQLQPVVNITNPLVIYAGNPDLCPEYTHTITVNYNQLNPTTYRSLYAVLITGFTANRIVTATTVSPIGVQTIHPVNSAGTVVVDGTVSTGKPFQARFLEGQVSSSTTLKYSSGVSYLATQLNVAHTIMLSQRLGLTVHFWKKVDVNLSGLASYQSVTYSLSSQSVPPVVNVQLSAGIHYPLVCGFQLTSDLTHVTLRGRPMGYNRHYSLWNATISRSFLKGQKGEMRFQANDILNQNQSLVRIVTNSYIEDSQTQVLKRYLLISFVYHLR
ncbi:outer membrane beta-barrel protein [Spirosoma oryzae]|uniref:outer membrane beta-barrel protein n=1 Tax=Spirosoma oryzae TaxID=1469603 RepID=UPI001472E2DD|nr:outer membrane beta-barrel protein [Spirosoma oryzae]